VTRSGHPHLDTVSDDAIRFAEIAERSGRSALFEQERANAAPPSADIHNDLRGARLCARARPPAVWVDHL